MSDYTGEEQVDDISQLPDCVLHHILSFIPTRDAVKTSILSKRWMNVWASVSNLDFDDALLYSSEREGREPPEVACFMDFVDRVLLLQEAANIQKFRLSCRLCFNSTRIHSWISYAIVHNVKELDLCLFAEDPSVLPTSIFSSATLTRLKLEMNCVLEIPTGVSFPCLKMLHLSLVTFPDDDSTQKLFLGCPVLEDLVLLDCEWSNLKNVKISSSTLKHLTIDDLPYFGPPDDYSSCTIVIDTPNLMCMKYTGYLTNEIFLHNLSSLVKAYVSVPIPHERIAPYVVDLIKGLRHVVSLTISNRTLESLVSADNMLHFPVFRNLTHVELSVQIGDHMVGALVKLLNYCPNLQYLHFTEGFGHDVCLVENDLVWSSLPKCLSSRPKTLTFKNFHGYDSEICFLKCVLKHALVSEKMNICFCKNPSGERYTQKSIKKELRTIARASKSCVVTFS